MKYKYQENVRYDKALRILNGTFIHNYEELLQTLKQLTNEEFEKQLQKDKEHFTYWIRENYADEELIQELKKTIKRKKYIELIENRIKKIKQETEEIKNLVKTRQEIKNKKTKIMPYIWLSIYGLLFVVVLFQQSYYTNQTNTKEQEINRQTLTINEIITQNNELNKQIKELTTKQTTLENKNEELQQKNEELIQLTTQYKTTGPKERIKENQITITKEGILIKIDDPMFAKFADTGSMLPVINEKTKAIQIKPTKPEDIIIGDIVSYEANEKIIIHRVINTGIDEQGWYAETKGDNNQKPDIQKIRFNQIQRILVTLIY